MQTKVCALKAMVFPVVILRMWELDHKEGWVPKNWCFWIVVLERTLESPLDCKEIKPVNPKGDQPFQYSLEGLMLKLKLQYFEYLMQRTDLLENTLMLGKTEGKRIGQQKMKWLDSITNSSDMSLSKLQEMGKDRGAWHATVHGFAKSWTRLSNWTTTIDNKLSPGWIRRRIKTEWEG